MWNSIKGLGNNSSQVNQQQNALQSQLCSLGNSSQVITNTFKKAYQLPSYDPTNITEMEEVLIALSDLQIDIKTDIQEIKFKIEQININKMATAPTYKELEDHPTLKAA